MSQLLGETSALLCALTNLCEGRNPAFAALMSLLGNAVLTSDDFLSLCSILGEAINLQTDGGSIVGDAEQVCVHLHDSTWCSSVIEFQAKTTQLIGHYQRAMQQGISIDNGLLRLLGDSRQSRKILLEILALNQSIQDPSLRNCWGMLIHMGFRMDTDVQAAERLMYNLQISLDGESDWDGNMISQCLNYERIKSELTLTFGTDVLGRCDAQEFINELLLLLVRYEQAVLLQ